MKYNDINLIETKKYKFNGWAWQILPNNLEEDFNPNEYIFDDIKDVAECFHTTSDNLEIIIKEEPIDLFLPQIHTILRTYKDFPRDKKRTKKVMREINKTGNLYPIYVENKDPNLFVMEGKHRLVAYILLGFKKIPVAYVSKKV